MDGLPFADPFADLFADPFAAQSNACANRRPYTTAVATPHT